MNPFGTAPQVNAVNAVETPIVFDIPPDPTWQPMDFDDVLEMDGFYCGKIVSERPFNGDTIIFGFELQDPDVMGKRLSKFLKLPTVNPKILPFWRNLLRSITGDVAGGQNGLQGYTPGKLTGALVYFKTEPYDGGQERRTSVAGFVTQLEHAAYVAAGKHRWPSVSKAAPASTPTGLPAGFPVPQPQVKAAAPSVAIPQPAAPVQAAVTPNVVPPAAVPQPAAKAFSFPGMK